MRGILTEERRVGGASDGRRLAAAEPQPGRLVMLSEPQPGQFVMLSERDLAWAR